MTKITALLLVMSLVAAAYAAQAEQPTQQTDIQSLYKQLASESSILAAQDGAYLSSSSAVSPYRAQIFTSNIQLIRTANLNTENTYRLEVNRFALLTADEFKLNYLGLWADDSQEAPRNLQGSLKLGDLKSASLDISRIAPITVDKLYLIPVNWTARGKVSAVRNQGGCGSCWAFAAAGALESTYLVQLSLPTTLSTQQLVDCSGPYGNHGCSGGWQYRAYHYIMAKKITTEAVYPYLHANGACKYNGIGLAMAGYTNATNTAANCAPLRTALNSRPQAVAVDASGWSFYGSGVYNSCPGSPSLNHAVLLTGLDYSNNWYIKNSWGTGWGVNGYITLKKDNCCGICIKPGSAPYL